MVVLPQTPGDLRILRDPTRGTKPGIGGQVCENSAWDRLVEAAGPTSDTPELSHPKESRRGASYPRAPTKRSNPRRSPVRRCLMSTEDEALTSGLTRRLVDGQDFIHSVEWNRLAEGGSIVGSCRRRKCGGLMKAQPTHQSGQITWYGAECLNCGAEIAAPDGRVLRRSSRHQEMPPGAWDQRMNTLNKLRDLTKGDAA